MPCDLFGFGDTASKDRHNYWIIEQINAEIFKNFGIFLYFRSNCNLNVRSLQRIGGKLC